MPLPASQPAITPSAPSPSVPVPHEVDPESRARSSQLAAARQVARAFFGDYIRVLYGRWRGGQVHGAALELRNRLERGSALTTPAERSAHPRLRRLRLTVAGPPVSVSATAFVALGREPTVELTATLEQRGHGWIVVAVGS